MHSVHQSVLPLWQYGSHRSNYKPARRGTTAGAPTTSYEIEWGTMVSRHWKLHSLKAPEVCFHSIYSVCQPVVVLWQYGSRRPLSFGRSVACGEPQPDTIVSRQWKLHSLKAPEIYFHSMHSVCQSVVVLWQYGSRRQVYALSTWLSLGLRVCSAGLIELDTMVSRQ